MPDYKAPVWVIQHEVRGVYVGFDFDRRTGEFRPHFRWSITWDHKDTWKSYNAFAAEKEYAKLPDNLKVRCKVIKLT